MKPKLFVFILGFIVGLLAALTIPPLIESWLPPGLTGAKSVTVGRVVAKRLQEDRLLLTIESEAGAVLATFKEKVPEIDLLVEKGDQVTLGITRYEPFVDDPKILGVKKGLEVEEGAMGEVREEMPPPREGAGAGGPAELMEPSEPPESMEEGSPTLPPVGPPAEAQAPPPR